MKLARVQLQNNQIRLSLLGVLLILFVGCSGVSQTQGPTVSPALTSIPGQSATGTSVNWVALESQPLHLPVLAPGASCPVTPERQKITPDRQYAAGSGPVYLVSSAITNPILFLDAGSSDPGSPWKISKVFWEIAASYSGPALIRGAQINDAHALGLNGGLGQAAGNPQGTEPVLRELRLLGASNGQWKTYLSFVRVQVPGCYAVQIDGQGFSEKIIFQAADA